MPLLHLDIETRSSAALDLAGPWRYAVDPTTSVNCLAFAVGDGPIATWISGQPIPQVFVEAVGEPAWNVAAHNAQFEFAITTHVLSRHGFPLIPIERFICTMAACLASALPPALDNAAAALGLPYRKDVDGYRLMKRMSKPRKIATLFSEEEERKDLETPLPVLRTGRRSGARAISPRAAALRRRAIGLGP
jgi:DNA polymerase